MIAGLVSVALAEWLILTRRHFWSGFEEALEVAGLFMLAYECWRQLGMSEPSGSWLAGVSLGFVGIRMLNPLLTTLAVIAFTYAIDAPPLATALVSYGAGIFALLASGQLIRRPSHDHMLDGLVIVMPLIGFLWSTHREHHWSTADYFTGGVTPWIVPVCCAAYATAALLTGLRRRTHAPLVACMLCVGCAAYDLRNLTGLSLETRLIVWGCVLLLAAITLERALQVARRGVTSRPVRAAGSSEGLLEIAGSVLLASHSSSPKAAPAFEGGGGRSGGGGASGTY